VNAISTSATGKASGFAWAGGVVGANANQALVANCYATGSVSAQAGTGPLPYGQPQSDEGALAGGIAGYSYFTANTTIQNSVALNPSLLGSQTVTPPITGVNRIVGRNGYSAGPATTLTNNWGRDGMSLTPPHTPIDDPNDVDGGTTSANPPDTFYIGLGWDFSTTPVWKMNSSGTYPILNWQL
jgi:hypothetical protein